MADHRPSRQVVPLSSRAVFQTQQEHHWRNLGKSNISCNDLLSQLGAVGG